MDYRKGLVSTRRYIIVAGMILLLAGVIYEEKHHAATLKHQPSQNEAEYPLLDLVLGTTPARFEDTVDLWSPTGVKADNLSLPPGGFTFGNQPAPANLRQLQLKNGAAGGEPMLTVEDRELQYALFSLGNFTLKLDLKPVYETADAWLPSRVTPEIGGSFSF